MLNLLPDTALQPSTEPAPEPVLRLASLHNALRAVDDFGGGPASDFDVDAGAQGWQRASAPARRCFDRRSATLVGVASAGLEAISAHRETGGAINPAAIDAIAEELRAGLEGLEALLVR